jgi:integrase
MAWGDKKAGFHYDAKRKTAHFNVVMRGTFHRKKKTLKGVTRVEAETAYRRFREEWVGAEGFARTLRGYWLGEFQKRKSTVGEKTWEGYVWAAEKKILPALGDTRLADVNDAVVTDFAVELEQHGGKGGRPVSASTVNRCLDLIRAILKDAYTRRVLSEMPVRAFPRREENEPHNELNEDEVERFYAALEQFPREKPYFIIATETGIRCGDLARLTWDAVRLSEGVITFTSEKTKVETIVGITPRCRKALLELKGRPVVGKWVFVTAKGQPLPDVTIRRVFERVKVAAEIGHHLRRHDLRHTCGQTLASRGVSRQHMQRWLGHKTGAMTDRYCRPSSASIAEVARTMK